MDGRDDAELLAAFDTQLRRNAADAPFAMRIELVEQPAPMLRITPPDGTAWGGGVFWSDLSEGNADAAIAATIDWFRPLGRRIEWKHYGYDRPADLPQRLRAAGFVAEEEEALVVGEVVHVRDRLTGSSPPVGVTVRRLREDERTEDWAAIRALNTAVWGSDHDDSIAMVAAEHAADPTAMSVWLAEDDKDQAVCAAWVRFHAGTEFASFWGGATRADYRGRGIYKALVSRRADEAAERGLRFVQVDASPDSRPILERLGLRVLATTTPWTWTP